MIAEDGGGSGGDGESGNDERWYSGVAFVRSSVIPRWYKSIASWLEEIWANSVYFSKWELFEYYLLAGEQSSKV
jgi:hypothetical protein